MSVLKGPFHIQSLHKKRKFSITGFFGTCDQLRRKLATITEEIFNGKLQFLCSECCQTKSIRKIKNVGMHLQLYHTLGVQTFADKKVIQGKKINL